MSLESAHEIAIARDASDPLRPWRAHFELPPGPERPEPAKLLPVLTAATTARHHHPSRSRP